MTRSRSFMPSAKVTPDKRKSKPDPMQEPSLRPSILKPASKAAAKQPVSAPVVSADNVGFNSPRLRERMVQTLQAKGISHPRVLQAMQQVPRHLFVDEGLASHAYFDDALPIGHGQTISQPYIVARMIEVLAQTVSPTAPALSTHQPLFNRVLEIGTGCGYQAAVLSCLARQVVSIERIQALHDLALHNLQACAPYLPRMNATYTNAPVCLYGDGMLGAPTYAPFDAVIFAAAGMQVPLTVLKQLKVGGRCVAPVVQSNHSQALLLIERLGAGDSPDNWRTTTLQSVHFVPLKSGVL